MLAAAGPGEGTCGAWQQLDCRCTLRLAHGIRRCMQEQQQLLQTSMCPHLPAVAGAVTGPQAELPAPSTTASAAAPSSCGRCCFGYTGAGVLLLDPAQGHLLLVCDHTESFNDCGGQIADAFKAQACAMLAPPAPPSQQQQPCNGCTSSQSACAAAAAGAAADAAAGCSTAVKPQQHQEQEALFQEPGASSVGISSSSRLAASDPSSLVSKATAATASQELLEETRGLVALPPAMLVRSQCGHVDMQNPNAPPWCPHHYRCYVLALPYVGNLCSTFASMTQEEVEALPDDFQETTALERFPVAQFLKSQEPLGQAVNAAGVARQLHPRGATAIQLAARAGLLSA